MSRKKISDDGIPYMTDSIKRALDKGRDLPIEQLVSEQGMAQIQAQDAARRAPIRAGDLRPISRAEAATRTTFDGSTLPVFPTTRRVIPEPFQRPRVAVSTLGGHGKTWQLVKAPQVTVGDIITDLGQVTLVQSRIRREDIAGSAGVAVGEDVVVAGAGGAVAVFDAGDDVRVFRAC